MWAGLKEQASRLKHDTLTAWFVMRHADTPWWIKALGVLIVAYALSPIDLIPDFVPLLGYLDELILLPALLWIVIRCTPPAVLAACRQQADAWMASDGSKPRSTLGAVIIVVIWLMLAWWLLSIFSTSLGREGIESWGALAH